MAGIRLGRVGVGINVVKIWGWYWNKSWKELGWVCWN